MIAIGYHKSDVVARTSLHGMNTFPQHSSQAQRLIAPFSYGRYNNKTRLQSAKGIPRYCLINTLLPRQANFFFTPTCWDHALTPKTLVHSK